MPSVPDPTDQVRNLVHERVQAVANGLVQIKAIAREIGQGTMIAVHSHHAHIDPIGECVGTRGILMKEIVRHLGGERLDIIRWADAPDQLIRGAFQSGDVERLDLDRSLRRAWIVTHLKPPYPNLFDPDRLDLLSRLTGYEIHVAAAGSE